MKMNMDDFKQMLFQNIGETPTDAEIEYMENVNDTLADFNGDVSAAEIDRLTAENNSLRQKYKERFESGAPTPQPQPPKPEQDDKLTFDNLWD